MSIDTTVPPTLWEPFITRIERRAGTKGRPHWAYGDGDSSWSRHTEGVICELALAKILGLLDFVPTVDVFTSEPDVPPFWEVRQVARGTMVKVHPKDDPDRLVAAVRSDAGKRIADLKIPTGEHARRLLGALRGTTFRCTFEGFIRAGGVQANPHKFPVDDPGGRRAPVQWVRLSQLVDVDEGWHRLHQWMRHPKTSVWLCAFCGARYEEDAAAS